jgi:uncharacterized protein (DUF302 family)
MGAIMQYYIAKDVNYSYAEALEKAAAALAAEGFGILTEIDVQAVLQKKTGDAFHPYKILGACNPQFAHRALELEDKVGVLLPCNVIVQQHPDGRVEVAAMNPAMMGPATGNTALAEIAGQAAAALGRVLAAL